MPDADHGPLPRQDANAVDAGGHACLLAEPPEIALDHAFPGEVDFAQDIQVAPDGRIAVTRWSGVVHVLDPEGQLHRVSLPRLDPAGLYYTAVLRGDRLCATYCADVTVVCVDAP